MESITPRRSFRLEAKKHKCSLCTEGKVGVIKQEQIDSQFIDWDKRIQVLPKKIKSYVDQDITKYVKKTKKSDYLPLFCPFEFQITPIISIEEKDIKGFGEQTYRTKLFKSRNNPNDNPRYQDWVIIIQQFQRFLVVCLQGCHPFVDTNKFSFSNSNGSTFEASPKCEQPQQIIKQALKKAKQYAIDY